MTQFTDREGNALTLYKWAELYENDGYRRVAMTHTGTGVRVSTIWEGMRSVDDDGPFETMILGGEHDKMTFRWETEEDALKGHELIVEQIKRGMAPNGYIRGADIGEEQK
jgi:hypothetical protein